MAYVYWEMNTVFFSPLHVLSSLDSFSTHYVLDQTVLLRVNVTYRRTSYRPFPDT
jgi:hypothetical protein